MPEPALITLATTIIDGGIGRNLLNLSRRFLEHGHRVHVIVDDTGGSYAPLLDPRAELIAIPTWHSVSGTAWMAWYLLRRRPAVLLLSDPRMTLVAVRARALTRAHTRLYTTLHNAYSRILAVKSASKQAKLLARIRATYPSCDGIIAVSRGVAEDFTALTGIGSGSLAVIYNPIVTDELSVLADEPVEHPWFGPGEPPVLLSVGRLDDQQKNLRLLVDAFSKLRAVRPARLAIIGEGDYRRPLEEQARRSAFAPDIAFLGHQSNPYRFMRRSAVLVLSSNWEGFGNVLAEAMATGTPVVSTDCPHGPREILEDGARGHLVPPNDAAALAGAIAATLDRPIASRVLTASAGRFRDSEIARQYLDLFGLRGEGAPGGGRGESARAGTRPA